MDLASFRREYFVFKGECPHCHKYAAFETVTEPFPEDLGSPKTRWVAALRCVACSDYILGIVQMVPVSAYSSEARYEIHYPSGIPDDSVAKEVPEEIAREFSEAVRCRGVDAYDATVEMCRRALETSCLQLGADPSTAIESQIDWVANQGRITAFLQAMARKIRLAGDRGVHPGTPLTAEEADAVIEFTREYFQNVYVTPAKMDKFDLARPAASKPES